MEPLPEELLAEIDKFWNQVGVLESIAESTNSASSERYMARVALEKSLFDLCSAYHKAYQEK